jgi:hypothetical protein
MMRFGITAKEDAPMNTLNDSWADRWIGGF